MDIENIAIVRATNIIPYDGIVRPVSEVPYLKKNTSTQFAFAISDLLRKNGIIPQISFTISDEERQAMQETIKEYVPYMSEYNSMVLWAINGLVPDDSENGFGNNTFSNKKCVIIDGLKEQLELSNVVSLVPTDTAIKGITKLSNSAIILIEQNAYEAMPEEQKQQMSNLTIKTFTGDLRKAVEETLLETGRYTPERPILSRSSGGYIKSDTSEELIETINNIAKDKKLLQLFHLDIIFNANRKELGDLQNEFDNINIVDSYYQRQFFEFLCKKINANPELTNMLLKNPNNNIYIKQLCTLIDEYGIDNYKNLVNEYNQNLETMKKEGTLLTPQEIVELEKSKINITDEIESVCDKYAYSNELEEALKICIPAMTKDKSQEEIKLLIETLKEVEIYDLRRKPKKEQLDYISETKIGERNKHVKYGKQDLGEYGKDIPPASYHYDIIFDEEMNAIDRSEYIYITRLTKEDEVSKIYGTQIDLSALIHELGHAWAARKEPYKQMENGNVIVRDGMRTDTLLVSREQKTVEYGETKGLYLEEAINTIQEEKALTQILGVLNIDRIEGYKKSTYQSSVMNTIARAYLEKLGANKPLETARIFNDKSGLEMLQESYSKTNL